jgi:leader peptidase (prepilin peptidase) / N-methyltransferase
VFYLLSFVLGASVGSFVQVIATRLHVAPIIKGRSKCLSCGEALRVSDLIPVVSYFLLRGRCRYCRAPYGVSALFIEIFFGGVFLSLYHFVLAPVPGMFESGLLLVYYTVLFIVLGVMALYDRVHSYVPIYFLLLFLVLTFSMFFVRLITNFSIEDLFAPILVATPFLVIWLVTKGKGVGFGDVLLFVGVGAFFGLYAGLAVFMLSVWTGAIVGLVVKYALKKKEGNKIAIPFVPFIALAFVLVLFTGIDIFSIAFLFG